MRPFRRPALAIPLALLIAAAPVRAQDQNSAETVPPQVREFIDLLDEPAVQAWIKEQRTSGTSVSLAAEPAPAEASPSRYVAERLTTVRQHLLDLATTAPTLPKQLAQAGTTLNLELQKSGTAHVLLLILLFVALGCALEWVFRRLARGVALWLAASPLDTAGQRLRAVGVRLGCGMGMVCAFAIGSVGAFLANDWPVLLREIALGYLLAFVILRAGLVFGRFLMAPYDERFRLLPIPTAAARFWYWRLSAAIGWLAFGWVTVGLLSTLGLSQPGRQLIAYMLGLGLLAIALEGTWHRPAASLRIDESAPVPNGARSMSTRAINWLVSGYFVLLWLLWTAGMMPAFWLAVIALALPASIGLARHVVTYILRPAGMDAVPTQVPTVAAVLLERGIRAMLIIAAALLLAHVWQIDLIALTADDSVATRLLRGAVSAVVIILVAEIGWRLACAVIDGRIAAAQAPAQPDTDEGRHRSRMRTLLPILRNLLLVVLIVMAALMVLSHMGIDIGPLIAGAGVIGVAVGFGAQTLVKDIISGVFYLFDDSFRIGEYIQSGNYKGTVESFSLRSVKLRHHRGPLYTVPFGDLGAVENMSRDWVIDKVTIGVTYDTNLEKARKLIKQVGKELAEDPEYKPHIIETLKMQGVEQFGDFAIQLRMKMTCKPGEQFVIRRKAFAMIKKAFDANGIKFAFPTVQVAGGDTNAAAAVAQQRIAMAKPVEAST